MKRIKQFLSFGLILAMTVCLFSGCGGTSEDGVKLSPLATSGPLAAYDKTVHVSYPAIYYDNVKYIDGESVTDNVVLKTIREKLNISYDAEYTISSQDLWTQINLAMSTNKLPDIFYTTDIQLANQLIENDMVEPLNDVLDKYATDKLKERLYANDGIYFEPVTSDGKIYGIPSLEDALNRTPVIYIREDWMNALGLSEPKTLDDLIKIARVFTFNDPDGNGKNDTWGIPLDQYFGFVGTTMYTFANANGAYYQQWVLKNGKLEWGGVQPEMRKTLQKMQSLYKEGLFDPDFYVRNDIESDLVNGKYGIMIGVFHNSTGMLANHYEKYGVDWKVFSVPVNNEGKCLTQINTPVAGYMFVKKGIEHPEALVKTLDLYCEMSITDMVEAQPDSSKYGNVAAEYGHMYFVPCQFADPLGNYNLGLRIADVVETGKADNLSKSDKVYWDKIQSGGTVGWKTRMYLAEVMPVIKNYMDNFHYSAYQGPTTKTEKEKKSELNSYEVGIYQMIISGEEDISKFDLYVEEWYKMGGQEWTDEVNEWYSKNK